MERGELLVYLDLDGVVHHQAVYQDRRQGIYVSQTEAPGRILFEWAGVLVDILRPYPSIKLVLSSSWCRRPGYSRTLKRLPVELHSRFVGGTFHRRAHGADQGAELAFATMPRGVQISTDVARRRPRDWLALDDDDRDWPVEHRGRLLLFNGELGLSDPSTQFELTRRLSSMVCRSTTYQSFKVSDEAVRLMEERCAAADMISVVAVGQLLSIEAPAVEDLVRTRQLLAIRAPGEAWRLPKWQLEEPVQSVMPKILWALDLEGWGALAWLETPLGGLEGLTPRVAVERGQSARVLQLARFEGV